MAYRQARRWCGTLNNPPGDVDPGEGVITDGPKGIQYFLAAEERGESGTRHSQFYLVLRKKRSLSGVRAILHSFKYDKSHLEIAGGSHEQCVNYIKGPYSKEQDDGSIKTKPARNDFYEYGEYVEAADAGRRQGEKSKRDWEEVRSLAKQGRFDEIPAEFDIPYFRQLRYLHQEARTATALPTPCGIYIWGHAGTGKSYIAQHEFGPYYNKGFNKWWCGYNGEDTVIMDDLDPDKAKGLDAELKIWSDQYPFAAEIKGGTTGVIRPKNFIITSQYSFDDMFTKNSPTWNALRRRFRIVHLFHDRTRNIIVRNCAERYVAPADMVFNGATLPTKPEVKAAEKVEELDVESLMQEDMKDWNVDEWLKSL